MNSKSELITLDVSVIKLIADAELTQVRVAGSAAHRDALIASLKADMEEEPDARFRAVKVVRATDYASESLFQYEMSLKGGLISNMK